MSDKVKMWSGSEEWESDPDAPHYVIVNSRKETVAFGPYRNLRSAMEALFRAERMKGSRITDVFTVVSLEDSVKIFQIMNQGEFTLYRPEQLAQKPARVPNMKTTYVEDIVVGHRVVDIRLLTNDEAAAHFWQPFRQPFCLELDNGVLLIPSIDEEGNDAGVLFYDDPNSDDIGKIIVQQEGGS